jgi:precorrin-6B methylase 2
MPAGSVLWDIGANIGIYSIYAAALGHKVIAIEPVEKYVSSLKRSIAANPELDITVVQAKAYGIDDLIDEGPPYLSPTHMKIDTDGDEIFVVAGALFAIKTVQSIIVETSILPEQWPETSRIIKMLRRSGLNMTARHVCHLKPHSHVGMDHWHR